jgi:hypothetical protein
VLAFGETRESRIVTSQLLTSSGRLAVLTAAALHAGPSRGSGLRIKTSIIARNAEGADSLATMGCGNPGMIAIRPSQVGSSNILL